MSVTFWTVLSALTLWCGRWISHRYTLFRRLRREKCDYIQNYPHTDPLFGYDLYAIQARGIADGRSTAMRAELYSAHGMTFASNWIGQPVLNTMEKDNIESVLGTSAHKFTMSPLRNAIAKPLLGEGLLTRDGSAWQRARSLAVSVLAKDQAADLPSLEGHLQKMLRLIPCDGITVDLQPLLKRLFIDKGTELVLGESINSLTPDDGPASSDVDKFMTTFEGALRVMGARLRLGKLRFIRGRDLQWKEQCREIHSSLNHFIDKAILRRNTGGSSKYHLIDKYLEVTDDRAEIQTQLINVFLAGRDQIGIATSLLMFALARHPDVWTKLRQEAQGVSPPLDRESVKAHRYARNVIYEGLRLYSPVLRSIRHCESDCILPRGGGKDGKSPILVTRGTQVEMDFGVMHRDESLWGQDAAEFKPDRWDSKHPGWEYIPFLGGKRACPAKEMVLTQMTYVIIRLAQEYANIENRDPVSELVDDIRNVRQSRHGVQVALHR